VKNIRKEVAYDGVCTVFIGDAVIVAGLTNSEADALIDAYRGQQESREAK
jgi:hypothetical protein